eukprot:m51a1_g12964 hypothetical protein (220) ;mRNA; r:1011-1931
MGCGASNNKVADQPGKKKKEKGDAEDEEITMEMQETHIESIDSVFSKAASPLKRLVDITNALKQARKAIKQIAKVKDVDDYIAKCIKDVKDTLKENNIELYLEVDDEGNVSLLVRPDVIPEHLRKTYEAVKSLGDACKTVVTEAKELKPDLEAIVEEAQVLPERVKDAATASGLSPLKIPGAIKATVNNVKELAKTPQMLIELVQEAQKLVKQIQKAFD